MPELVRPVALVYKAGRQMTAVKIIIHDAGQAYTVDFNLHHPSFKRYTCAAFPGSRWSLEKINNRVYAQRK